MIDLRGIDLNLLVSLDALLEVRNVTKAAERLHLTQPAVSTQLGRLRRIFDDPLLIPAETGRGMVVTARGLELVDPLRMALQGIESVVRYRPQFDPKRAQRIFRIAANDNSVALVGLNFMERLPQLAGPGVRVAFTNIVEQRLVEQLEQGEIDLVIGSERLMPDTMKARKLLDERFLMVQRKGHPRGTAPLDIGTYCALEHVLVSTSGGSFHGFMDEHLERLGRQRHVAVSVQTFTLVPELLAHSDYVSTLPSRLVARYDDHLDAFALPFEAQGFSLFAAWHPRYHADPAAIWLRDSLASGGNAG